MARIDERQGKRWEVILSDGWTLRRFVLSRRRILMAKVAAAFLTASTLVSVAVISVQHGENQKLQHSLEVRDEHILAQQDVIERLNADHERTKIDLWKVSHLLSDLHASVHDGEESAQADEQAALAKARLDELEQLYEQVSDDIVLLERNLYGHDINYDASFDKLAYLERVQRQISGLEETANLVLKEAGTPARNERHKMPEPLTIAIEFLREKEEALARDIVQNHALLFGEHTALPCHLSNGGGITEAMRAYLSLSERLEEIVSGLASAAQEVFERTLLEHAPSHQEVADFREVSLAYAQASERLQNEIRNFLSLPAGSPLKSRLPTSFFGPRKDPFTGRTRAHQGLDFAAPRGTEIRSPSRGIVSFTGARGAYGNVVEVEHGYGLLTRYAHLSSISVSEGDEVAPHDLLGLVGTTGRSTGNHLHYEVILNGQRVNPIHFVNAYDIKSDCHSLLAATKKKEESKDVQEESS